MPRIQVPFPKQGLDEDPNYAEQDPSTSSDISNVRTHDTIKGRSRGGRRPALSKFHPVVISGAAPIQRMRKATRPQQYSDTVAAAAYAAGVGHELVLLRTDGTTQHKWQRPLGLQGAFWDGNNFAYVNGPRDTVVAGKEGHVFRWNLDSETVQATYTDWAFDIDVGGAGGHLGEAIAFNQLANHIVATGPASTTWTGASGVNANVWALNPDTGAVIWNALVGVTQVFDVRINSQGEVIVATNQTIFKLASSDGALVSSYTFDTTGINAVAAIDVRADDQILVVLTANSTTWDGTDGTVKDIFHLDANLALKQKANTASDWAGRHACWIGLNDDFVVMNEQVPATQQILIRATFVNDVISSVWSGVYGGADCWFDALDSEEIILIMPETIIYPGTAGALADYFRVNGLTGSVITFVNNADVTGSLAPRKASLLTESIQVKTRETSLIIAANGDIKRLAAGGLTTPTGGLASMTPEIFRIQMVQSADKVFMIDGTNDKYYDLSDDSVKDWSADVTAGVLPALQRLLTRYRGRAVHAGSVLDPQNYFMSKVGDFFDYDFAPGTTTAIQAIAGNLSEAGLVGDIITALIAMNDDALVFGCDQTIWMMAGDPAAGGSIDLISDDTGIAWNAWTKDPDNVIYFLGIDGIYRMKLGEQPESITHNRLDELFERIDLAVNRVLLAWDYLRHGLIVIIANTVTGRANQAFFYSARDDAWTLDEYPAIIGPSSLLAYDAEDPDDKAMLFGCSDGFIRKVDPTAKDDDGNAISSNVRYTPMAMSGGATDVKLRGVTVILAEGSKDLDLNIYKGQTAEQCAISTTPRIKRALKAGRNEVDTRRLQAPWIQVELSQTNKSEPWAVEAIFVEIEEGGKTRRHRI